MIFVLNQMLSTKDKVIVNGCSLHVDKANSVSDEAIPFTLLQCHALQWGININADLMSVLTWVPPAVCRIPCNLLLW